MLEEDVKVGEELVINFSYTNKFGNNTNLNKTFDSSMLLDSDEFLFLMNEFKVFLLAIGFSNDKIEKIIVVKSRGG